MLDRLLQREKPRVFIGAIAVVPRKDIKRHLDQWGFIHDEEIDVGLQASLQKIFAFPSVSDVATPKPTDLGLDVLIPKLQSGGYWEILLGEGGVPVFWRPKVTVVCRLYHLKSNKTTRTLSVTQKMPWGQFIGRILTLRAIFGLRAAFDAGDMDRLLWLACHALLEKLKNAA